VCMLRERERESVCVYAYFFRCVSHKGVPRSSPNSLPSWEAPKTGQLEWRALYSVTATLSHARNAPSSASLPKSG